MLLFFSAIKLVRMISNCQNAMRLATHSAFHQNTVNVAITSHLFDPYRSTRLRSFAFNSVRACVRMSETSSIAPSFCRYNATYHYPSQSHSHQHGNDELSLFRMRCLWTSWRALYACVSVRLCLSAWCANASLSCSVDSAVFVHRHTVIRYFYFCFWFWCFFLNSFRLK